MGMDYDEILERQKNIIQYSEDIYLIRRKLMSHENILESAWKGPEANSIVWSLEELRNDLKKIEYDLADLGHDFVKRAELLCDDS